jgi:hypothetical protein
MSLLPGAAYRTRPAIGAGKPPAIYVAEEINKRSCGDARTS